MTVSWRIRGGRRSRQIRDQKSTIKDFPSYWERTCWPLQSLYFLLPLILIYEIGIVLWVGPMDIRARGLLRLLLEHLGATGVYLPGLAVVVVLVSWHLMRRDPWRPEPKLYAGMWLESVALTLPLCVFVVLFFGGDPMWYISDWRAKLILPIGAGIYEELVFRLIALVLLHLLLKDLLALPTQYATVAAVAISSVAFALYHFSADDPFQWGRFAFYTLAGIYFAAIYLLRGFGIVVAVHALYNVVLALISIWQSGAGAEAM